MGLVVACPRAGPPVISLELKPGGEASLDSWQSLDSKAQPASPFRVSRLADTPTFAPAQFQVSCATPAPLAFVPRLAGLTVEVASFGF